jgi:FkbM family methyltransferase
MNGFLEVIKEVFGEQTPKVILDVGSRDLEHSLIFGGTYPEARIIAFEPNPFGIKNCKFRLANLKHSNIELMEFAVSDQEGEMDFYSVGVNDGCSSLLEPIDVPFGLKQWAKITVPVKRLDNVLEGLNISAVDVLWLDTQGTELQVLKGLGSYLNNVKCIHTEACPKAYYKGHILQNELESFLHEQGFETRFFPAKGHPYGEGDLICIRK